MRLPCGFTSASAIHEIILAAVSGDILETKDSNAYGNGFKASIQIIEPSVSTRQVQTAGIVLDGE